MDLSEMITGFLVVLVIAILIIDTVIDWRSPAKAAKQARQIAAPASTASIRRSAATSSGVERLRTVTRRP